jgi:hypothetical protein
MMLGRVMPEPPDFDLHTFMCPQCEFVNCIAIEASATQVRMNGSAPEPLGREPVGTLTQSLLEK